MPTQSSTPESSSDQDKLSPTTDRPVGDNAVLRHFLDQANALAQRACSNLGGDLDNEQLQLFDLAFSAAELEACAVILRKLDEEPKLKDNVSSSLLRDVARFFVAETLLNQRTRIAARTGDYGLTLADLNFTAITTNGVALTVDDFISQSMASSSMDALCQQFQLNGGEPAGAELPDEQRMIRDSFRQFAQQQVAPLAQRIHREDLTIPDELIDGLRELGCFGLSVPERFGGLNPDDGDDSLGMVIVTEELSRGSLGAAGSLITRPEILARALLEGGTQEQQAQWLPGLASGATLCAISVTEPAAGSDVASVRLRAQRSDGGWLLNGNKTWCTFAGKADVLLVLARTDTQVVPPHKGLSLFLVEKPRTDAHSFEHTQDGGGSVVGKAIPTLGYRGMHSYEMFYDNFFVPDSNLIGGDAGLGKGFYYTMRGFMGGRLQTAARATGLMRAAFDASLRYCEDREVFGKALGEYGLSRAKLARMGAYISVCQLFSYNVAGQMDSGGGATEASLVKLLACRLAEWVTREALQLHGGMGYAEESAVSRYFVDARVLSIFEGAEETLAIRVVGKSLLADARREVADEPALSAGR